jgi:excisionase family DNA binding protein
MDTPMTEPFVVPIPEAARLIGCGRSKLYELLNAKEIPLLKLGRKSVIPLAALRAFIIAKTKEAA